MSRAARRTSKCQSVSEVDSLPSHRRGLAFSDRKCSVLSKPLLFSFSPFLLPSFEGRLNFFKLFHVQVSTLFHLSPCINRYLVRHRSIPRYRSSVHIILGSTSCPHLESNCQPAHDRISYRLLIAVSIFLHLSYSALLRSLVIFRASFFSFTSSVATHFVATKLSLSIFTVSFYNFRVIRLTKFYDIDFS